MLESACACIPWYLAYRLYTLGRTDLLDEAAAYLESMYLNMTTNSSSFLREDVLPLQNDSSWGTLEPIQNTKYGLYVCGFVKNLGCESLLESNIRTRYTPPQSYFQDREHQLVAHTVTPAVATNNNRSPRTVELEDCPEPCSYNEWDVDVSLTVFPPTEEYYTRSKSSEVVLLRKVIITR